MPDEAFDVLAIMKKYTCLLVADTHGVVEHYEKLRSIVMEQDISFVFLCGDLFPKGGGRWHPENTLRTIGAQRAFIQDYFLGYLEKLSAHAHIYAIFGNDDFRSNYDLVQNLGERCVFLDRQIVRLPIPEMELFVAGYPYVSLTPFLHKDWEKWDDAGSMEQKMYTTDGYDSQNGGHVPISFANHADGRTTIAEDLDELARKSDPKKTMYLIHEPPYGTPLDMVSEDNKFIENGHVHVGSRAVRSFIEKEQPLFTMHGHIHETFRESGEYLWRCGSSVAITPSHDYAQPLLTYIAFDLPHLEAIERRVE